MRLIIWLRRWFNRRKVRGIRFHTPPVVIPSPKMLPRSLKMLTCKIRLIRTPNPVLSEQAFKRFLPAVLTL